MLDGTSRQNRADLRRDFARLVTNDEAGRERYPGKPNRLEETAMSVSSQAGRLASVRLVDVPLKLRLRAAERLMKHEDEIKVMERMALLHAAHFPSDQVYFVRETEVERVLGPSYLTQPTVVLRPEPPRRGVTIPEHWGFDDDP